MTNSASTLIISPTSDKRLWSNLNNRVEQLLESRNSQLPSSISTTVDGDSSRAKRMKEDSMLLIRGFDSIASSLSQLTSNLDNALQGTRDLAKSSTLTEIIHNTISSTNNKSEDEHDGKSENGEDIGEEKKGLKRKIDECCSDEQGENEKKKQHQTDMQLKKVRNLAVSMASKSASLAKELKTVKSDMCFLQERCAILEEENRRLRDGFGEGIRPDEDDLVRLQLEALLAEKSRLATDNANLTRENQCLKQLVEYHQFATQDLSASYEQVIEGLCLDFSSPGAEERSNNGSIEDQEDHRYNESVEDQEDVLMPRSDDFDFHTPLRADFVEDEELVNH
ncbi:uncharacterized protein LOC141592246 [Silene latifolia]|uniref:uncharacterized protein LOC141592246 n=1 Tax=Silene latifolia TaxID=37657 RepID=UPI003D771D78